MENTENSGLLEEEDLDDIVEKTTSRVKSAEELESHTIDEEIDNVSKSIILLKSCYEAQVICGIRMIPEMLYNDADDCIIRVFPDFKEICFHEDLNRTQEFYTTLNESLIKILTQQLITSKEFSFHFVDLITKKIYLYCDKPTDYENYSIFQLWVELMLAVIENLMDNCVKTAIFDQIPRMKLQFAAKRTREYVALILAKCAAKLTHQAVQMQLFPVLLDLCNDTQYEVRALACQSLAPICKIMGPDLTMNMVIPEMSNYLCDESVLVKTSCFQSLVEILEIFEEEDDAKIYLLRKIQSFVDYGLSLRDEHYLMTISKNIGTIVTNLKDIMNSQAKSSFINIFAQICRDENLYARRSTNEATFIWCKCKINLANAFPEVLQITNSINFENKLSHCLTSLVRDKNENVREAIVLKFIEIAQKLGSSQYFMIITDYCTSLTDDSPLVLNSSIKQLSKFLNLFIKKNESNGILNESQQMPGHQLVTKRLIKLEDTLSHTYKYAVHCEILQVFELLPWLLCTEILVDDILPILDKRSSCRALPVRLTAIRSLLIILRKIPRFQVRHFYITKLIDDFSLNTNCYKRTIFIEISKLILELYSKNFFKQNFYKPLLKLAKDPVVNVRISFIKILPDLKRLWKTTDRDKLENLEVVARGLLNDKDRDVSELAYKAITQMDYIRTHGNNENEERENRFKDKEEMVLMDLEPKKSGSKGGSNSQAPETKKSTLKNSHSKSQQFNNQYPSHLKMSSANHHLSSLTKSVDYNSNSSRNPMYQSHLTESYNLKEKKSISLSLSEKEPSHRERSKRTEPRRNSYNSENINQQNSSTYHGKSSYKKK